MPQEYGFRAGEMLVLRAGSSDRENALRHCCTLRITFKKTRKILESKPMVKETLASAICASPVTFVGSG